MPVFASARERSRATACLSNLRQIGFAAMQYAGDYDEGLPAWDAYYAASHYGAMTGVSKDAPIYYWQTKLQPYVKSGNLDVNAAYDNSGVWHCPDLGDQGEEYLCSQIVSSGCGAYGSPGSSYSYGYNFVMLYTNAPSQASPTKLPGYSTTAGYYRYPILTEMDMPASTIFVGECGYPGWIGAPFEHKTSSKRATAGQLINQWEIYDRHNGGANYLFADGHAKWMPAAVVYPPPATPASTTYTKADIVSTAAYFSYNAADRAYYTNLANSMQ